MTLLTSNNCYTEIFNLKYQCMHHFLAKETNYNEQIKQAKKHDQYTIISIQRC